MNRLVKLLIVALLSVLATLTFALEFPAKADRFVNDFASMMNTTEQNTLNSKLAKFRDESKVSIVVVTITSAQDYGASGLAELGVTLFDKWKPGQTDLNSGVLVIVAGKIPPYKIRIVTGRGLEGPVPDLIAKRIIEQSMKPSMHSGTPGAFALGLTLGADALMELTRNEFATPPTAIGSQTNSYGYLLYVVPLSIALIFAVFLHRYNARRDEEKRQRRTDEMYEQLEKMRSDYPHTAPPRPPASVRGSSRNDDDLSTAAIILAVSTLPDSSSENSSSGSSTDSDSYSSPDSGGESAGGVAGDD